jgi:hypothetical protein
LSIKTVIVDLESIATPQPPLVAKSVLEALANTITQLKGLVHPPILKAVGIDEYELLSGHLEFYAYLQARKFDESLPDRLTALIADKKTEDAIRQQLQVIQQSTGSNSSSQSTANSSASLDLGNLEAKLDRLSSHRDQSMQALKESLLAAIDQKIPRPIIVLPILEAFDRIQEPEIAIQVQKNLQLALGKTKAQKAVSLLQAAKVKKLDLTKLATVREVLTESRNGKSTKLVSDKKILEVMESWS